MNRGASLALPNSYIHDQSSCRRYSRCHKHHTQAFAIRCLAIYPFDRVYLRTIACVSRRRVFPTAVRLFPHACRLLCSKAGLSTCTKTDSDVRCGIDGWHVLQNESRNARTENQTTGRMHTGSLRAKGGCSGWCSGWCK